MRTVRVLFFTVSGLVVLLAGVGITWSYASQAGDPLDALLREVVRFEVVGDSAYAASTTSGEARVFRDLTIDTDRAGTIRVTTSRPAEATEEPLPLVVILAGLRTGRESLGVVGAHGSNLLVGYEYPYNEETWYQRTRLAQIPVIRRAVLDVPWQVARVTELLRAEPDVDPDRASLLGYSFGAMFVPAVQRVAAARGRPFEATILAYGGVDIGALIDANLRIDPRPIRRSLARIAATLLHPVEPELHLPHMQGPTLVIRGLADEKIPTRLSDRLVELTPDPREVVTLDAGHMGPRDPELTKRVVGISQDWLTRIGAIEPVQLTR